MKNILFILFIFIGTCTSCQETVVFTESMDKELSHIVSYLDESEFEGTFVVKTEGVDFKYSKSQPSINLKFVESLNANEIIGVTRTSQFSFFVVKGWKGNNYGYLLTKNQIESINGIDEFQKLNSSVIDGATWYYVGTHLY